MLNFKSSLYQHTRVSCQPFLQQFHPQRKLKHAEIWSSLQDSRHLMPNTALKIPTAICNTTMHLQTSNQHTAMRLKPMQSYKRKFICCIININRGKNWLTISAVQMFLYLDISWMSADCAVKEATKLKIKSTSKPKPSFPWDSWVFHFGLGLL